jgi:CubicO group peptidase (beta-lactamase class C family)
VTGLAGPLICKVENQPTIKNYHEKKQLTFEILIYFGLYFSCHSQEIKINKFALLDNKIDSMRIAFNIPAVAYGVVRNDSIIVLNVLGYRDIETKEEAQKTDYFHIGSNTKSFTAFLSGRLVDDGKINWDTKFFDLYPELKVIANSAYFEMNLQELLSHRARLINFKNEIEVPTIIAEYERKLLDELSISEKRYHLIKHILQKEPLPVFDKCADFYSNAGYIAAGLMLEKASGFKWEEMMMKLSDELNLDLLIGWPDDFEPKQPKGHINPKYWNLDIQRDLVPISDQLRMYHSFNQSNLLTTPSGNISIKPEKFLEYLRLHLNGIKGVDNYLKSDTYKHILTTYSKYSHGWWIDIIDGDTEYAHRGSNGTFYSFAGFFPQRNTGIIVMINTYNESGLTDIIQLICETIK